MWDGLYKVASNARFLISVPKLRPNIMHTIVVSKIML